jgi:ParB family chromosome partitioning protein
MAQAHASKSTGAKRVSPAARVNAVSRALKSVRNEAPIDLEDLFAVPSLPPDDASDPDASNPNTQPASDVMLIRWDALARNESQPRAHFDEEALRELADSIRQDGQLQPILVRPHPSEPEKYQIVAGERRWRACGPSYADLPFVRAVVRRNLDDDQSFRLALIENIMREDLNDVEKARGLVALKASLEKINTRVKWSDVAQALGYSSVHVSRLVSMLRLPPDVQEGVQQGAVSSRQARAIAREADPHKRAELVQKARLGLSSDAIEKQVTPRPRGKSPIRRERHSSGADSAVETKRVEWSRRAQAQVSEILQLAESGDQSARNQTSRALREIAAIYEQAAQSVSNATSAAGGE